MHRRLGSATLSQLAFPGEGNPNFPWEIPYYLKKKRKRYCSATVLSKASISQQGLRRIIGGNIVKTLTKAPIHLSGTVLRQWDEAYSCHGSRHTLTSSSDSVLCLMGIAYARFLLDTTNCPTVTSKSVCRTTAVSYTHLTLPTRRTV